MQLCDAHGLPIITLIDTRDVVGPDVEQTVGATLQPIVRHRRKRDGASDFGGLEKVIWLGTGDDGRKH